MSFTDSDAERFLEELPAALPPTEEAPLRESVCAAEASMTGAPTNVVFAK